MRMTAGAYELDDDPGRIDPGAAVAFLTTEAYWARWRSAEDIKRQITGAWRVVGVYDRAGAMVGFARAFADGANAYLGDVYVLPEHRGAGLGKAIMQLMIEDGPGARWRWMLHTADAHGLYRQFGFAAPSSRFLERPQRIDAAAPGSAASATGTLAGQVVRLEPLGHQHVPGLAAASRRRRGTVPLVGGAAGRRPGPPVRRDGGRGPRRRDRGAVRGRTGQRRHGHRVDAVLRPGVLGLAG